MSTNNAINELGPTPLMFAYLSATVPNQVGDSSVVTVPFDTILYDTTSSFNVGTYTYTAPMTGKYLINSTICLTPAGVTATASYLKIVTTSLTYDTFDYNGVVIGSGYFPATQLVSLSQSDTAYLQVMFKTISSVKDIGFSGDNTIMKTRLSINLIR